MVSDVTKSNAVIVSYEYDVTVSYAFTGSYYVTVNYDVTVRFSMMLKEVTKPAVQRLHVLVSL